MPSAATLLQLVAAPLASADGGAMPGQDQDAAATFSGLVARMMAPADETDAAAPQAVQAERTSEAPVAAAVTAQIIAPQLEAEQAATPEQSAGAAASPRGITLPVEADTAPVTPAAATAPAMAPRIETEAPLPIRAATPQTEKAATATVSVSTTNPQADAEPTAAAEPAPQAAAIVAQPVATGPKRENRFEVDMPAKEQAGQDEPVPAASDPAADLVADWAVMPLPVAAQVAAPKAAEAAVPASTPAPLTLKAAARNPESSDSAKDEADSAQDDATPVAGNTAQSAKATGVDSIKSERSATVKPVLPDVVKAEAAQAAAPAQAFSLQPVAPEVPASTYTPAATVATPAVPQIASETPAQPATPASTLSHAAVEQLTQLSVAIQKRLGDGTTKFQLELKPADLGRIDVALTITGEGKVSAHLEFDTPITATTFAARESELRQQLTAAGLKLDGDALTFSSRAADTTQAQATPSQATQSQANPFADPQTGQQPRSTPRQASRALKQANKTAAEADLDSALAQLRQRPGSGRLALDLTV